MRRTGGANRSTAAALRLPFSVGMHMINKARNFWQTCQTQSRLFFCNIMSVAGSDAAAESNSSASDEDVDDDWFPEAEPTPEEKPMSLAMLQVQQTLQEAEAANAAAEAEAAANSAAEEAEAAANSAAEQSASVEEAIEIQERCARFSCGET